MRLHPLAFAVVPFCLAALAFGSVARAAEAPKTCCKIIRVNAEKGTAWLRNPGNGAVAQIRLGDGDEDRFKVGDHFDPEANALNGTPLERRYAMVLPELDLNAHIIRARGAEMAAEIDATKTVHRIYALKFGRVLSSVKPGLAIYIDETARWAFIPLEGYGKVKPSVWAFALD